MVLPGPALERDHPRARSAVRRGLGPARGADPLRELIIPIGLTHGLGRWADLTVEMTPYYSGTEICFSTNVCRLPLFGLIAAAGVTIGRPFISTPAVELGWMVAPRALMAVAYEIALVNP